MLLTSEEREQLVNVRYGMPHQLLGMHHLGDGSGLVVRALVPEAVGIQVVPAPGAEGSKIDLEKIDDAGLFEGVTQESADIFAYDLVVKHESGAEQRARDPYSFLPTLGDSDLYLFGQGREMRIYDKLGGRLREIDGVPGTSFAVWAPSAQAVSVVGDFNNWDGRRHPMRSLGGSGVWEIFIPGVGQGALYKFEIKGADGAPMVKTDPYGHFFEVAPKNSAIVWDTRAFTWTDGEWLHKRELARPLEEPLSIYELHVGSWKKKSEAESLSYRELAAPLIEYLDETGFTHVEFLPVAEHAYYPSWGYQVTGFYAPTSRFGTPDDFQYLVNELHRAGYGVIVDWVPAHFPRDEWALAKFDGTALYEHADPRKGAHQDWGTLIFNFSRHEVRNFLIANARYWVERFHIDGLRVDAVASMLYLDYSRNEGEWIPNEHGGRENLEAIEFLKEFNHEVQSAFPGVMTIAEESTAWPQVTRPPYLGGLGFTFKWNMGWMHDTLGYFGREPIHRQYHQNDLTFATLYQHNENFALPLSHDEVVHGKGSLLGRMPGDDWQKFANLRALLAYQWLFSGKQLLFMGGEIGQPSEWNENGELEWGLLEKGPYHAGLKRFIGDLNEFYKSEPALWKSDYSHDGFFWVDCSDRENSVLSFVRQDTASGRKVLVVMNLTPMVREPYRLGLPEGGVWKEAVNSDAEIYGGGNVGNAGAVTAEEEPCHGHPWSAEFVLPPLSVVAFQSAGD